ncbi:ATP-binding protein [Persephonella sp. KM09-Lau-8]|uniref:GAF domain-containing sensor histidine kinase n=1 Tax=Persephonella sp. KM09-Lau-8 TaxID=1158345 RepID=UPI0004982E05|nr:ATP-binding protein [Persephonella sp. KM09-Lau-8]
MQALIFSWLTFLIGVVFLEKGLKNVKYLAGSFLTLVVIFVLSSFPLNYNLLNSLFILYFYFIFLHIFSDKSWKLKGYITAYYLLVLIVYIGLFFYKPEYLNFVVPFAIFPLLFKKNYSRTDTILWVLIVLSVALSYPINHQIFYILNILFALFFIKESVQKLYIELEKEKRRYRDFVDRAINSEIQKQYAQLDDELKITYKKLKEIFKLSNYTLSPSKIEDIAERVVEGLHNLGYSGVVVYVDTGEENIYRKSGFFPNINSYLSDKFQSIEKITISPDEKHIFLPLKSDKGKIGVLGVYKKEGIMPKEIEYLSTYANSVAISITKTIYFREINKLQELLEKTFESVDIGIAIVNKDFRIEKANKALLNIIGQEPDADIFNLIPELQPLEKDFKEVIQKRKTIDTVLSSISEKGSIYRVKALPLISGDFEDTENIVLIIEDITEKEKLEAQLLETEKHAVIGKMAAGLSHDIKNPLAAIAASAFAIKKRAKTLNDNRIIQLSEKIEKNSQRASDIITRLLNYAKPSYYKIEKVDLREILLSALDLALPENLKRKVKISKRLGKNIYTYGDATALQRVFINLLMNSIEAMNNEGKIDIRLTKNENYAVISIKDYGPGIPEDMIEHIFDPFFTTKEKGTGLGLSVVSKIIKDHRGEIEVKSKENEGTEFVVKLPLAED